MKASEAGLASGLINTSQQIGGALGIAGALHDRHVAVRGLGHQRRGSARGAGRRVPLAFLVGAVFAALGVCRARHLSAVMKLEMEYVAEPGRRAGARRRR